MNRRAITLGAVGVVALTLAAGFGLGRLSKKIVSPPAATEGRKALYWYDPMVPAQHFDKPGKSPFMDMELVPKYGDEAGATAGVAIDPARVQNLGIRYATVTRGDIGQGITAPGVIDFNQRDIAIIQARTGGFVQRVYARAPGDVIAAGAPFADVLVPEWAGAQTEFLAVRRTEDVALIAASRQRLTLLGMSPGLIASVERSGRPSATTTITTPTGGVIRTLSVRAGMTLTAGQTLAEVNGLATVWVNVSVPASQASTLRSGQAAQVSLGGETANPLVGRVSAILPEVSGESRTLQVRIELANPGGRLRPGGFATAVFAGGARQTLVVPDEAVIRTGKRALVMVALPGGRFQPAEVQLGQDAGDRVEVLSGLTEGEKIVISGQFLIDSEASLSGLQPRAAPMSMSPTPPPAARPRMKSQAVAALITMPIPATIITIPPATGWGSWKRRTASQAMAPMANSSSMALPRAARMVARP